MDKTLDAMKVIHRLLMLLSLAMIVVGSSVEQPTDKYMSAKSELEYLANIAESLSKQREEVYKNIYDNSDLKRSVIAWLTSRNSNQKDVEIATTDPDGIAVPDLERDPHMTIEREVEWADNVFGSLYIPFVICEANPKSIEAALNSTFKRRTPKIVAVNVMIRPKYGSSNSIVGPWICSISVAFVREIGSVSTTESSALDLPTHPLEVQSNQWVGPDDVEVDSASWLKGQGFGDWEDNKIAPIAAIREIWSEIREHDVSEVETFLDQQEMAERRRSEQKIDIFGQRLNGALSTMFLPVLTLLVVLYLVSLAQHVKIIAGRNRRAIRESPLLGLLNNWTGKAVIICTISIFPVTATLFDLIAIFPKFQSQWPGPLWVVSPYSRWACVGAMALLTALAVRLLMRIASRARLLTRPAAPEGANP